jgi:asparagine synthase (glutamine-hydrolysing)
LGGHEEERFTYFKELWKRKKMSSLFVELLGTLPQHKIYNTFNDIDLKRFLIPHRKGKSATEQLFPSNSVAVSNTERTGNKPESLDELLLEEVTQTLMLDHLQFGDRAASAFSTETRYPFLDCRLVEFVFTLSGSQKLRHGWTKYVLRESMKGIIPESIRKRRRKLGTPTPFDWLIDLEKEIKTLFESAKFRERGYFNQQAILKMYDRYCTGKMNNFEKNVYAAVFWRALNLELWFESFFD